LAGGAGERFWPLSNRATPKQLLRLEGDRTLLETAFDRAARLAPVERVFVGAGERLAPAILAALPQLPPDNLILEPIARNTAACIALAACRLERRLGADVVMGVLTADHVIEEGPLFERAVGAALAHAARFDRLVTIGIQPTRAHTGFGYLELAEEVARERTNLGEEAVRRVARFTEKPDRADAERFIESGGYLWNSGMFFWRVGVLFDEFARHQPAMAAQWRRLRESGESEPPGLVREIFDALPAEPIDVAIMEKSDRVAAVAGRFAWRDVGSWDALAEVRETDASGNCAVGPAQFVESTDCIAYNDDRGPGPVPEIVAFGLEGIVIVRTERALLVTRRSMAQDVKRLVREFEREGREDLL
jgi:mannose-1-phosphate guanylyltransferase